MARMMKVVVATTMAMGLGACATIISGTSQEIHVRAIDKNTQQEITFAKCSLTNSKNVVYPVYGNPGSVSVAKEYGGLKVNCLAKGYRQTDVGAGESFNAWTLVDIIFWPSFFVDAATGAAKKYPSHLTVLMQKV